MPASKKAKNPQLERWRKFHKHKWTDRASLRLADERRKFVNKKFLREHALNREFFAPDDDDSP